jgi:hypothetical protein
VRQTRKNERKTIIFINNIDNDYENNILRRERANQKGLFQQPRWHWGRKAKAVY